MAQEQQMGKNLRFPAVRVFIEDLNQGVWNFDEDKLETRYGKIKRALICGFVVQKDEFIEESSDSPFIEDTIGANSRIIFLIDDGTGRIRGTLWVPDVDVYRNINKGKLIIATGVVNVYNQRVQLRLDFISEADTQNYEIYHRLKILERRKNGPLFNVSKREEISEIMDVDFTEGFNSINSKIENIPDLENFDVPIGNEFDHDMNENGFVNGEEVMGDSSLMDGELEDAEMPIATDGALVNQGGNISEMILKYIQEHDEGDGVLGDEIIKNLNLDKTKFFEIVEKMIQDLELYKPGPNRYACY